MKPLGALVVLMSATVSAAPLPIRVVGDTCPLSAQLSQASGVTVVEAGQDFDVMLEREGDEWRVLLKKPDGTVALRRTLSGAKQCADVTFAAQLILERFARELDVKVAVPVPAPAPPKILTPPVPPPRPVVVPRPEPEPVPPPPPLPEPEPPPRPLLFAPPAVETSAAVPSPIGVRGRPLRISRVELSAGGGGWFAFGFPARGGFAAELAAFLSETWRLSAQLALTTAQTIELFDIRSGGKRGQFSSQPFLAAVTGGYCRTPNVRACGSLVVGAHVESGATEGDHIFNQRDLVRATPAFGLEIQVAWLPVQTLTVALTGTVLVLPVEAKWEIEGLLTQPLPVFEGLLRLSIGFGANR